MDKYLKAIREKICTICPDSSDNGKCTLNKDEVCALELNLEKIVHVVNSIKSDKIEDYFDSLHNIVCKECKAQNESGFCSLREDVNCSIDRLFPRIVEVLKEVE